MILTQLPLDNPWKRGAIGFFTFNMASTLMMWIAFDIEGFSQEFLIEIFVFIPIISIILFFFGDFFLAVDRVKFFVLILGFFGVLPILFSCILPFFLYILISNFSILANFLLAGSYFFSSTLWIFLSIKNTAKIEKKFDYLRSQISDRGGNKIIKRKYLLDFSNLNKKQRGKKINFIRFVIVPLSFMGYPLQKIISSFGGDTAVLGFVSILAIPLSIYFMGKIASGYYLWIYCISKLEKEYKSKIILVPNPE